MWKRLFETSKVLSVRMLSSYLAMLAAPLAAIVIFYVQTSGALLNVQYEKSYSLLTESVNSFERQMSEIGNVSLHLLKNPDVLRFSKGYRNRLDEFWDKYCFVQRQPDYSMTNQMIESVYFLVKDSRYIIRLPAVVPANALGYQSVSRFSMETYEELMDYFCETWSYGHIFFPDDRNGQGKMAMVYSLSGIGKPVSGAIVVTFNRAVVEDTLEGCSPYDSSAAFVLDNRGNALLDLSAADASVSSAELADALAKDGIRWGETDKDEVSMTDGYQTLKIGEKKYLVCLKKSDSQNWYYAAATPVRVLTEQINSVRIWMIVLMSAALLITLLICTYHWSKRRVIIRQYCDLRAGIKENSKRQGKPYFWNVLKDLMEYVVTLQATLSLQENLVRSSVLRKLLYGDYISQEELLEDQKHAGLEFPARKCFVAVWSFEGVLSSGAFRDMVEFRTFIRGFIGEELRVFHHLYEVNYNTLAIIISDPGIDSLTEVRNLFLACSNRLKERVVVDAYTGTADAVTDLLKLSSAFEEARDACDYARYYRMATPISGDEMPKPSVNLFFSGDLEARLNRVIKDGNDGELSLLFDEIQQTLKKQKPSLSMVNHYMNFVRSTAIHTLSEYCVEQPVLAKVGQISEAESWNDLLRLIGEAKKLIREMMKQQTGEEPEPMKEELLELLYKNYADPGFGLCVLAENYGVSESKMYKDFRLYFGKSFAEMLETIRMEKACGFLREGISVKEVTSMTGYCSDTSFRRAFKRIVGMTPTEYCQSDGKK